ncbi:MAG: sulfotransferase [Emcibacter sp.]|nr:sulfotransferase [Emcibacter sp.]
MSENALSRALYQGQQYLKSGHAREAYAIARKMRDDFPDDASVLAFMSKVEISVGQLEQSLDHILKAVKLAPDQQSYQIILAENYAAMNMWKKSETTLDQVVSQADNDFQILDSAAALYSLCNMYEKSRDTIIKALKLKPDNAALIYNLAIQQRFLGDMEGALDSLDRAIERDPKNTEAVYIRSGLRRQTKQSNHIPFIIDRLEELKNIQQAKIQLNYALAKEYEDLEEWNKSFKALNAGAKAKRQTIKYDSARNIEILTRTATLQTKEYLSTPVPACRREAPIFILGLPRTGSTLVDTIISSHKDVVSAGELPDFPKQFALALKKAAAKTPGLGRDRMALSLKIDFKALGQGYVDAADGKVTYSKHFTDKLPFNFQYCGMIKRALPNARIIHVRRDPMDSCYSIYKALFLSPYPFSYDLTDLAQYFVAYYRLMDHWRAALPGAILDVNYEDVIADHEQEARRIIDWCGLDWDPACLNYRETKKAITTLSAAQVRGKIYSSSIGKWRHFEKQMAPVKKILEDAGIPFK